KSIPSPGNWISCKPFWRTTCRTRSLIWLRLSPRLMSTAATRRFQTLKRKRHEPGRKQNAAGNGHERVVSELEANEGILERRQEPGIRKKIFGRTFRGRRNRRCRDGSIG